MSRSTFLASRQWILQLPQRGFRVCTELEEAPLRQLSERAIRMRVEEKNPAPIQARGGIRGMPRPLERECADLVPCQCIKGVTENYQT
jgi:hypothetical protein